MRLERTRGQGLCAEEVEKRRAEFGTNALPVRAGRSFLRSFLSEFSDPIIRILLGALLINCLFLSKTFDVLETVGIAAAVFGAAFISALSERGGERAFARLQADAQRTMCRVRRSGEDMVIPIDGLVVGDLVYVGAGDRIPADGVLMSGHLRISQAALNGEAREVERLAQSVLPEIHDGLWHMDDARLLFRGAVVTWGEGMMQICRVGAGTVYGTLTAELQTDGRESPLKNRLSVLAGQMSRVGYIAAGGVALSYLFNTFFLDAGCSLAGTALLLGDRAFVLSSLLHALTLGVTTIVMAVPEGLPMMISVVLSANIRRMQRDRVLVRKPVGIETAGSMDLLFCDKTGTLTVGVPTLSEIWMQDGVYGTWEELHRRAPSAARCFDISCVYNTQSRLALVGGVRRAVGGNAADRALLDAVTEGGRLPAGLPAADTVCDRIPFDSARKCAQVRVGNEVYVKGAPEVVLRGVTRCMTSDGGRGMFDRTAAEAYVRQMASRAGRILAVCVERGGERCFLCLVCVRDDLRPEARDAVARLHNAGIGVVMITGDSAETASAIAEEAGIFDRSNASPGAVLTSDMLAGMDDAQVRAALPALRVLARALPRDKSRLVRAAQEAGYVVGMTGDGVNDAPALRCADVGFALGGGTEVAQEAGDIVILDDNIASICRAVQYGRTIFKSIRKFIMFQMTTNLLAVGISLLCPLIGVDAPVTVLQMLWINLIMDTLGSLAFAGEMPSEETMKEKPKRHGELIMNGYMVRRIAWMGSYLLALCLWFMHSERMREHFSFYEDPVHFLGAFFALFIFADIANSVSARTAHINPFYGLSRNRAFLVIFTFIIAAQLGMIYFGGALFRTCPLAPTDLLLLVLLAATVLVWSVLVKTLLRRKYRAE